MIIAIPTANGKLCDHFGHCRNFSLVNVDMASRKILKIHQLIPPQHAPGVYPQWLAEQGVELVLANGMGTRAQQLFEENGIEVLIGVAGSEPYEVVQAYLEGILSAGENLCDH